MRQLQSKYSTKLFRSTQVVGMVLAIGGMVFLGAVCNKSTNNSNVNAVTNVTSNANQNTNSIENTNASKIDTSDWLTYTNDEYGFSFRYPKEWVVSVNDANLVKVLDPMLVVEGKVTIENSESFSNMLEKEVLMIAPGKETMPLVDESFLKINHLPAYRSLRQLKKGDFLRPTAEDSAERVESTSTEIEYRYFKSNNLVRVTFSIQGDTYENSSDIVDAIGQSFSI